MGEGFVRMGLGGQEGEGCYGDVMRIENKLREKRMCIECMLRACSGAGLESCRHHTRV